MLGAKSRKCLCFFGLAASYVDSMWTRKQRRSNALRHPVHMVCTCARTSPQPKRSLHPDTPAFN